MTTVKRTKRTYTKSINLRGQTPMKAIVVRRSRFEGHSFEVIESPSLRIIAQGFETEESAQDFIVHERHIK